MTVHEHVEDDDEKNNLNFSLIIISSTSAQCTVFALTENDTSC